MASLQKRPTGWRAVIRRKGHAPQIKTFRIKSAAEAWAREIERDMDRAEFVDRRSFKKTARELMENYRDTVSPGKKGAHWEKVRLKKLMREPWTLKPVNEITRSDITSWRDSQGVSGASVRREMTLLSSVFNHAIKELGYPIKNPLQGVSKPKENEARNRRPTGSEFGALRSRFEKTSMELLVELATETAMRLGELCSLKWVDVHLEERFIRLYDTKNGSPRDVPLSKRAVQLLQAQPKAEKVIGITAGTAGVYWREACKELGIEDLHFHDLRHEATTRLAAKLDMLELSRVTGHKDPRMLRRYYNPTPAELADKLD